ncbi:MAG: hypothetical protein QXR30_03155 [Candidatus Woesearchaeota archaeon]
MDLYTHFITATVLREKNDSFNELLLKKGLDYNFIRYVSCAADVDNIWRFFKPDYKPNHFGNFHTRTFDELTDFSLGVALHGEKITIKNIEFRGIDYYTHKKNGYIDLLRNDVKKILEKYELDDLVEFDHGIIEFVTGHYLLEKYDAYEEEFRKTMLSKEYTEKFINNIDPIFKPLGKIVKHIAVPLLKSYIKHYENLDDICYSTYVLGKKQWVKFFKKDKAIKSKIELALDEIQPMLYEKVNKDNLIYKNLFNDVINFDYTLFLQEQSNEEKQSKLILPNSTEKERKLPNFSYYL